MLSGGRREECFTFIEEPKPAQTNQHCSNHELSCGPSTCVRIGESANYFSNK